jgi:thymidylate kinase
LILKSKKLQGEYIVRKEAKAEQDTIQKLTEIFENNTEKRILVLGPTCAGKTTLLKSLPKCLDMDALVWELLPKKIQEELSSPSWTDEMSKTWRKYVIKSKQIIKIEVGRPLFAATSFDSDIIVYLNIDKNTLRERTKKRGIKYETAVENDNRIKEEIRVANLPVTVVDII